MWKHLPGRNSLLLVFLSLSLTTPLSAQHRLGGGLGYLFDRSSDFVVFTGDARIQMPGWKFVFNPRFDYFLGTGTTIQFDGNLLYDVTPLGRFRPYLGGGLAENHSRIESSVIGVDDFSATRVGANLIYGGLVGLRPASSVQFFGHLQYTAAPDLSDTMVLYAGALLNLGGGRVQAARRR